jgi:hypothetical protein
MKKVGVARSKSIETMSWKRACWTIAQIKEFSWIYFLNAWSWVGKKENGMRTLEAFEFVFVKNWNLLIVANYEVETSASEAYSADDSKQFELKKQFLIDAPPNFNHWILAAS